MFGCTWLRTHYLPRSRWACIPEGLFDIIHNILLHTRQSLWQGKRLTVANETTISIGQPILRVAIVQLETHKIYLAPVIFRLRFVKKALFGDKIICKNRQWKLFQMKLSRTFHSLWPGYCLFWLWKRNTMHKIPGTSAVYWVAWFVVPDCDKTSEKPQRKV